ncbi:MAG TPA: TolC family protein [Candidatus Binataceae bacterium]|nr:TolC family protein [Candidatus Binataceae bacterium]
MRRPVLTLFMLGVICAVAGAADPPSTPRRISLDQALAMALSGNRVLKAAGFAREAADAQIGVARGAMLPRLDADENFSYTDSPVQVFSSRLLQQEFTQADFALSQLNHPDFLSNFQSQARLSFPLFTGGRLMAAYRAAGFAADAERWQVVQTRQKVEFEVIRDYYAAVLAEQQVAVVDRALAAARAHLAQADDLYRHGMAVNSDVLRTDVLVGMLEQQRIQAESLLSVAWATLAHALGAEDQPLAPLEKPAELEAPTSPPGQLGPLILRAVADRPEIKIADSRVQQADQAVAIARADYLPTVEIAGVYENDSERLIRAGNNGALVVTGRLNLFDGLATQSKLSAAHADRSRAQVLADDLRHAVALEVETAYRNLVAAQQSLEVAQRDTAYADNALKTLEDRYGSGLATNVSVLDAQSAREETDLRLVVSRVNVAVDRAALNLSTGTEPQQSSGK